MFLEQKGLEMVTIINCYGLPAFDGSLVCSPASWKAFPNQETLKIQKLKLSLLKRRQKLLLGVPHIVHPIFKIKIYKSTKRQNRGEERAQENILLPLKMSMNLHRFTGAMSNSTPFWEWGPWLHCTLGQEGAQLSLLHPPLKTLNFQKTALEQCRHIYLIRIRLTVQCI